jgi:hypothetical protein
VKSNEGLSNRVSIIIRRYTDRMKFYCFFHILLVLFCVIIYFVICFVCFYLILYITFGLVYLFIHSVTYVTLGTSITDNNYAFVLL